MYAVVDLSTEDACAGAVEAAVKAMGESLTDVRARNTVKETDIETN